MVEGFEAGWLSLHDTAWDVHTSPAIVKLLLQRYRRSRRTQSAVPFRIKALLPMSLGSPFDIQLAFELSASFCAFVSAGSSP